MGQDPEAIRNEIEQTRGRMGDTADALVYKTDVKGRAQDSVSEKLGSVRDRIGGARESAPGGEDVKDTARRAGGIAQENPLGLAIGSAAVGFLAGLLIPTSRAEDERIGPVADQVKEKVAATGQEAFEHGKQVAQEAAQSAAQTAQESGREHVQQVQETAQQNAQDVSQTAQQQAQEQRQQVGSTS